LGALIEQASGPTKAAFERIRDHHAKIRSRYLFGRVLCTAITAIFLVDFFHHWAPQFAPYLAFAATGMLTGTLVEISTTLGHKRADRAAPAMTRYLRPLEIALLPFAIPLAWLGAKLSSKEGEEPPDPKIAEAEVEMMVDEVERSGGFGKEPAEMIRNVLEFVDRTARDAMVPRSRIEAIEATMPLEKVLEIVANSGHSRYPVYRDQLDNVIGLLYAKDLFKVLEEHRMKNTTLADIVRSPANFVAESQPLSSLLREMRGRRQHMAIVVDEFGGLSGIVTLEDVLEEIVGDIRDEHDVEEPPPIQDLGDGRLVADAAISMSDLSAYLGTEIKADGEGESIENESIEGVLTQHLGHVPSVGTAVSKYGLRFIVRDSDEQHIGKVEIVRSRSAEA
jgi:CBS domain containing-hemolysin-like protein